MSVRQYFAEVAEELRRRSDRLRYGFSTHRPSIGSNREYLVGDLLQQYLPKRFGVASGLVISTSGEFSREPDVLIVDQKWNAPLYGEYGKELWLIEAVYGVVEVKTRLGPSELHDAIGKCRRFKTLPKRYCNIVPPRLQESLFIIWAFESAEPEVFFKTLMSELSGVPRTEHPDFVVVPNSILTVGGSYLDVFNLGLPGSSARIQIASGQIPAAKVEEALAKPQVLDLGANSLLFFLAWLTWWLKVAGDRSAALEQYCGIDGEAVGKLVQQGDHGGA